MSKIEQILDSTRFWVLLGIAFLFVCFCVVLAVNSGIEYSNYKDRFQIKCESKGGIMIITTNLRGWHKPECIDTNAVVKINA